MSVDRRKRPVDRAKVEAAVEALLEGLGFDVDHPSLRTTPTKTAEAFTDALTVGYKETAAEALGRGFPTKGTGPVMAKDLPLLFVCPHHLMPARGVVHLAFQPRERVPGLARLARLVDTLGRRLVLQEDLTDDLAAALFEQLDARGALVIIEAQHTCVALEDFARRDTTFVTRASRGDAAVIATLTAQIEARLEPSTRSPTNKL